MAIDVIPTEILERLEVRKTITPDMDGDSIGGRVNLKTISPFDKGGRFGSGNFEVDGPWEEIDAEDGSSGFFVPEIEFREYQVARERKSVSANFESRVNETSVLYLRGTYNYFSDQEYRSRAEVKLEDGAIQPLTDTSAFVTDIEEADRDLKNRFEEQEIHLLSAGGKTK